MADPRRRSGRARSGRGGRIPRRGESGGVPIARGECFPSFPLDVCGPITVPAALNAGAGEELIREIYRGESSLQQDLLRLLQEDSELDEPARGRLSGLAAAAGARAARTAGLLGDAAEAEPPAATDEAGAPDALDATRRAAVRHLELSTRWEALHSLGLAAGRPEWLDVATEALDECERGVRQARSEALKVALFRAHQLPAG